MKVEEALNDRGVREALAVHYRSGVAKAETGYASHAADEDAVTGGLGESLRGAGSAVLADGTLALWRTTYSKLRGRGDGAPEKRLGADGVFEIEVEDAAGTRSRKSLFFQAKNRRNTKVRPQASQIAQLPGGALVVTYGAEGYRAAVAADIWLSGPRHADSTSLADALVGGFLECRLGSTSYFYDANREVVVLAEGGVITELPKLFVPHRIRTTIVL